MRRDRARRRGPSTQASAAGARGLPGGARPSAKGPPPAWLGPVLAVAPPALAVLAAVLVHARAIGAPFFADDLLFLDVVRSRSLPEALLAPDPIGNFFRPLGRVIWFWLFAHASGESAVAFHVANLVLFVTCVALLWFLVRRTAGERAAAIAAGLLALTHAADVPVRWASGSQDLLATTLALGAMLAFVSGRRVAAAILFFLAPLAKEVVALAIVPAALLARGRREAWRATVERAWPALAGLAAWLAMAGWAALHHQGDTPLSLSPLSPLAAAVGALRVLLGIEWATAAAADETGSSVPPTAVIAVALAAFAAWLARAESQPSAAARTGATPAASAPSPADLRLAAGAWVLVGALPVALVAPIWSAYFYLFAACGASLLVGALFSAWPRVLGVAVVVALGLLARQAGGVREFATRPDPFGALSHVNTYYLERGMSVISRAIEDFKRLRPRPEPRTTFFFTGLPSFAGVQTADGPLVRAVYRDSSLRSYYLTDLDRARIERGPAAFLFYDPPTGHFKDESNDPDLFLRVTLGHLLSGREDSAREALEIGLARGRSTATMHYLAAFMALEAGDRKAASERFAAAGCLEAAGGDDVLALANQRVTARDTLGAIRVLVESVDRHVLDPRIHGRLADLQLMVFSQREAAAFESYIVRVLAPNEGRAWRRWAFALFVQSRFPQAQAALDRYFKLDPLAANRDPGALELRRLLPRILPGGDLLQRGLRREAER